MFLGDELTDILESIEKGEEAHEVTKTYMETGVLALPKFAKDTTDRNRTSPFAFTGNKFEFRSLGSTASIAGPNIVLNTIVAEELEQFADRLDQATDITAEVLAIVKETMAEHKRIIFNGNNYSDEWVEEAARRGLPNLKTSVDAIPQFASEKSIALFEKHGIFSRTEVESRTDILLEGYAKVINIEALTMLDMAKKEILPAVLKYNKEVFETLKAKQELGLNISVEKEQSYATKLSNLTESLMSKIDELDQVLLDARNHEEVFDHAKYYREYVFESMQTLRMVADELETMVSATEWPFPTYVDLLFYV